MFDLQVALAGLVVFHHYGGYEVVRLAYRGDIRIGWGFGAGEVGQRRGIWKSGAGKGKRGKGKGERGKGKGERGKGKGERGKGKKGKKKKGDSLIFGKPLVGNPAAALQIITLLNTNRFGCGSLMPWPTCATKGRIINAATV